MVDNKFHVICILPQFLKIKNFFKKTEMIRWGCVCVCVCESLMSDSLPPHGLQPARLLHPWDSPGKNTGVDCHSLLQGIFPTQGSNPGLLHCRYQVCGTNNILKELSIHHIWVFTSTYKCLGHDYEQSITLASSLNHLSQQRSLCPPIWGDC